MTDRIMLRAYADENTVQFRTVSARMKSPQRFYVTYGELDRLQRDGSIISNDIHSFVQIRLDEQRDRLRFDFTWLTGRSLDRVEGTEQTVNLRWSAFREFRGGRALMCGGLILHGQEDMAKAYYGLHT